MRQWNVWHQYCPARLAEPDRGKRGEDVRFYRAAVFPRGVVVAEDASDAIAEAIRLRLSPWPLVQEAT